MLRVPIRRSVPIPRPSVKVSRLPSGSNFHPLVILDRAVVFLETGVSFFAWFLLAAILVEPCDGLPGPVCRCLSCHRIEPGRKGEVFGKLRTQRLHIKLRDAVPIHPEPDGLVADELRDTNRLV